MISGSVLYSRVSGKTGYKILWFRILLQLGLFTLTFLHLIHSGSNCMPYAWSLYAHQGAQVLVAPAWLIISAGGLSYWHMSTTI